MDDPNDLPRGRFVSTELGQVWKPAVKKRPSQHSAHNDAKAELRVVLSNWKKRTGISAYYIPYFVGKVWLGENPRKLRKAFIGKSGVADCFIATMGQVLACEVKTGSGDVSALQESFKQRWEKTGNYHIIYRQPSDLIDALDRIKRTRGSWNAVG